MNEKLEALERRYEELTALLADPSVIADQQEYQKYAREHSRLTDIVGAFREYRRLQQELTDARAMLEDKLDDAMRQLVKEEFESLKALVEEQEQRLRFMLLPKDPNDDRNVVLEIRGGTGGDEAALFAADLFRMYTRYAERRGWKTEVVDTSETEGGGYKEVVFTIDGQGAYSRLKYESGVHRVQRVPDTEAQGRIHTSTATVAVLPEVEDVDIDINPGDLQIDTYRSSGAGGQHVNKTSSAIRITHLPTGVIVACQDERSQLKNKDKAMKILRAKLYDLALQQQNDAVTAERRSQVGTGERSEKIRTYNFPQSRVTDHRIGLTLHKLDFIMDGDLDDMIEPLITTAEAERLRNAE
ncbi:MAG: peptide chain release factor 1 [Symbiobacteriia bacterium]